MDIVAKQKPLSRCVSLLQTNKLLSTIDAGRTIARRNARVSLRLQMLQVARLSRNTLGNSLELVSKFLKSTACAGGGFSNRQGQVDLYYSAFAADAILAVDESWDSTELEPWLMQYGSGSSLDFVHLCCLVRLWAACGKRRCPSSMSDSFVERLETFRSSDGGFSSRLGATSGTAYGSFLALGAYGDLGRELSNPAGIEHSLASLKTADGGWSNEPRRLVGSTAATAAAVVVMHSLGQSIDPDAIRWLLEQRHATGGFVAAPGVPLPDLLSTAVALHALDATQAPWRQWREGVLDFIDSLWTAEGAFHGSWADDIPDAEYTYYGLVALGHASV